MNTNHIVTINIQNKTKMIKVLANNCYGGFCFSEQFVEEVFKKFPPHTELGIRLFEPINYLKYVIDKNKKYIERKTFYDVGLFEVIEETDFIESYKYVKYIHKWEKGEYEQTYILHVPSQKLYKHNSTCHKSWRAEQEIVSFAQEYGLAKASGEHAKLYVRKVPDGYDYRIQEYDGMESVIISIPFDRIIQDLLDKINGKDSNIHPLTKKLIEGKDLIEIKREGWNTTEDEESE